MADDKRLPYDVSDAIRRGKAAIMEDVLQGKVPLDVRNWGDLLGWNNDPDSYGLMEGEMPDHEDAGIGDPMRPLVLDELDKWIRSGGIYATLGQLQANLHKPFSEIFLRPKPDEPKPEPADEEKPKSRMSRAAWKAHIHETVAKGQYEILRLVREGRIPYDVPDFSALHDYIDANEIAGACEESPDNMVRYEPTDENTDFWNTVQDSLSLWIQVGSIKAIFSEYLLPYFEEEGREEFLHEEHKKS